MAPSSDVPLRASTTAMRSNGSVKVRILDGRVKISSTFRAFASFRWLR